MLMFARSSLLLGILLLSGCSYLHGGGQDDAYLNARSISPLNIPPGLSSSTIHEEYPIPYRSYPEADKKVTLVPPDVHS